MSEMLVNEDVKERFILIGVQTAERSEMIPMEDSLVELEELVQTAGGDSVACVVQNAQRIHPGTYMGSGKLEEVRQMLAMYDADGVVCDDELSPAQMNNLERILECKVLDRTMVILDIFAARARSSEGKIQVELAQLRYRAAQLVGMRASLSRLGGGIGTRGPGEKKLEMDRRLIHGRISKLKEDLQTVQKHRELIREKRKENHVPTVAIVGYTNAGKSTFLNKMTGSDVLEEDKLFATLDPTTRLLELENGQEILLTDTVGFIHKLPHHLIEAFKSTLEEAKYADYIIHMVDASDPMRDMHMQVVYDTLHDLEADQKKILTLFNKCDRLEDRHGLHDRRAEKCLQISALTGEGLDECCRALVELVKESYILLERIFSYKDAGLLQLIRREGQLLEEEYLADGIRVKANVPVELYGRLS